MVKSMFWPLRNIRFSLTLGALALGVWGLVALTGTQQVAAAGYLPAKDPELFQRAVRMCDVEQGTQESRARRSEGVQVATDHELPQ